MKAVPLAIFLAVAFSARAEPLLHVAEPVESTQRMLLDGDGVPVPVDARLEIRFTAKATGSHTVEADPRIGIRNPQEASHLKLEFSGNGNPAPVLLPVLSQTSREYRRELYVPPGATHLRVSLRPAKESTLTVANLRIALAPEAPSINPHPAFLHGELNPYGHHSGYGGGFYQRPDGVTVWNTGFTGTSPEFPVEGGKAYTVSCRGTGYSGKKSRLLLQLFKAGEPRPFHEIALTLDGATGTIHLPGDAARARLLGYDVILESWNLNLAPNLP